MHNIEKWSNTLKIFQYENRKIFKVHLAIFQHFARNGKDPNDLKPGANLLFCESHIYGSFWPD